MSRFYSSLLQDDYPRLPIRDGLIAPFILLILTLAVFNTSLFDSTKILGSDFGGDLPAQFLPWRKFGFDELKQGNLALWNPHIYGGAPYLAGFQSALLYPPNWLHLIFPVGLAINWINALHLFAAGYFTNLWGRARGLNVGASILAGVMFMFSGAFFLRIYAGHLPHMAAMIWVPLLFVSIDLLIKGLIAMGSLLGMGVMTMLLFAGHPQYVYYTGIVALAYVILNLRRFQNLPLGLAGCSVIVLGGVAIASIQLLSGIEANSESVRSSGMGYAFIENGRFPPENFLTMLTPNALGPLPTSTITLDELVVKTDAYFGRGALWEACVFVSVAGLILAIYGMVARPFNKTRGLFALTMVVLVLSLGSHTPLHRFLSDWLPGFSWFRGSGKFSFLIALFLSLFAAYGFDLLWRARRIPVALFVITATLFVFAAGVSLAIKTPAASATGGAWQQVLLAILESGESILDTTFLEDDRFFLNAAKIASRAFMQSAAVTCIIAAILIAARFRFKFILLMIPLAVVELVTFSFSMRTTIDSESMLSKQWMELVRSRPANSRIIGINNENLGMWFGYNDVWGYDPSVQKRYAELAFFSQAQNPDDASQHLTFVKTHFNIFPLLRVSGVIRDDPNQPLIQTPAPMAVAELIPKAVVLKSRDEIFSTLDPNSFDPRKVVLLESELAIKLAGSGELGAVTLVDQSTDHIDLDVDAKRNAILLVTNAYSRGWKATSRTPAGQSSYDIVPANWALQAIPVSAGKHQLRLEYRPRAFVIGKWISISALAAYLGALFWYWRWLKNGRAKSDVMNQ